MTRLRRRHMGRVLTADFHRAARTPPRAVATLGLRCSPGRRGNAMSRREFLALLGGTAGVLPRAARAQSVDRAKRMGILIEYAENDPEAQARLAALRKGLDALGWTEGRNLRSEIRFGAGSVTRIHSLAEELAASTPDVIFGSGAPVTAALQRATRRVPIVFVQISDPVGAGLVPSLGRPGGNITGFTNFEYAMVSKWLEALKEIAPRVTRVLLVQNPANFGWPGYIRAMEAAAPLFDVRFAPGAAVDADAIRRAIEEFAREPNGGLIVLPDTTTGTNRELIVTLAAYYRLPAIYPFRFFVDAGGLMSYGIRPPRRFPARRFLRRPHYARREARRSASAIAKQIRTGDQPQDRASHWPDATTRTPHPRRRGDRLRRRSPAIASTPGTCMSAVCHKRTRRIGRRGVSAPHAGALHTPHALRSGSSRFFAIRSASLSSITARCLHIVSNDRRVADKRCDASRGISVIARANSCSHSDACARLLQMSGCAQKKFCAALFTAKATRKPQFGFVRGPRTQNRRNSCRMQAYGTAESTGNRIGI